MASTYGIFFDIDDTLYSRRALLLQAAREAVEFAQGRAAVSGSSLEQTASPDKQAPASASLSFDEQEFMRIFYIKSDENFPLVESGQITPLESNIWRLEETFRALHLPCPAGTGSFFAERYSYLQDHITLPPDLLDMFEGLMPYTAPSGHMTPGGNILCLRLGILTNGESAHQRKKIKMLGLDRFIPEDRIVVSGDVGISKPEEGIFRAAEKVMDLPQGRIWLAGDSLKHDIGGAKAAGWHTIWMDRSGAGRGSVSRARMTSIARQAPAKRGMSAQGSPAAPADVTVHNETQLAHLLKELTPFRESSPRG